jgi:tol-pal system protein YbgF
MFRRFWVLALIAVTAITLAPDRSAAASKEIMELQRDVAQLQESIKQLQQSQDKQLAALTAMVQQAIDGSIRANTSVAVIERNLQDNLRKEQSDVVAPVVGLTSRMNALSDDMRTLTQAVSELNASMAKLQSQLTDVGERVKAIPIQPAPPPQGGTMTSPQQQGGSMGPPPGSSQDLYNQALGDRNGGKTDLALQEFTDYLKFYGSTDLAPNAQFYIASIHMSQGAYDQAAAEFDMVLEKYPENNKTREAMMYKGQSLVRAGQKTKGADEFREIITRYPHTDQATAACKELTALGYHCPTAPAKTVSKKKKGY